MKFLLHIYRKNKLIIFCFNRPWLDNEVGIKCRQILGFLTELLPYSHYLRGYLIHNKELCFSQNDQYLSCFSSQNIPFLELVLMVVTSIGRIVRIIYVYKHK